MKKFIVFLILLGVIVASPGLADGFNPNYILDDNDINDYTSMSLSDIQQFLNDRGGFLATYHTTNPNGTTMSAAEIIYDRAINNRVNPKFLIALLQKEQSLIESKNPKPAQLDWAVGYGCFDNQACNPRWQGLWRQLNSASLQFRDYLDNPQDYHYQIGQTYTLLNSDNPPTIVTPQNQTTCAFYNYTPHVYWGNFNFYNIWTRYFIRDYPNGTLLQAQGQPTVWVLQNGSKRPIKSRDVLLSRYDINKIITVSQTDLDKYITGTPISFPQYSIVRAPTGALYLLVDDTRRGFTSKLAFAKIGFNPEEIITGSWSDIQAYKETAPITATSTYPTGALLQDKKTGGVYWVISNQKAPIVDRIYLSTLFRRKRIQKSTTVDLAKIPTTDPVRFPDGELIRGITNSAVYVIADGKKRPIQSAKVFTSLKYSWTNVITVPDKILYLYPDGEALKEKTNSNNLGNQPDFTNLAATSSLTTSLASTTISTSTQN